MHIVQGTNATTIGSSDRFTGDVSSDSLAIGGSGVNAAVEHFIPAARTAWHTHGHGQTMYITEGAGRVQREGGKVEHVHTGDVISFEPEKNHWPIDDTHRDVDAAKFRTRHLKGYFRHR